MKDFTVSFQFSINPAPRKTFWGPIATHLCLSTVLINHAGLFVSAPFDQIGVI